LGAVLNGYGTLTVAPTTASGPRQFVIRGRLSVVTVRGDRRLLAAVGPMLLTDAAVARWGDLAHRSLLALLFGLTWVAFALGAWWVLQADGPTGERASRRSLRLVVVLAGLLQLPGLFAGQHITNDAYRYVWDGRVQLAGVSPYRYAPLDDHLARLRDPLLFPGLRPDQKSGVVTLKKLPTDKHQLKLLDTQDTRSRMNHDRVTTIYPPVAEAWFTIVALVTPWSWGTHGLQIGAALLSVGLTGLLGRWFRRRDVDPRRALLWGWCPTAVIEASIGAHADVLAAVLLGGAVIVLTGSARGRRLIGGLLLGLSIGAKLTPILLLPAFALVRKRGARPRDVRVPLTALATAIGTYVPHVIAAGTLVFGFLPGYLNEEGFDDGQGRYAVLGLVLPPGLRKPVALVLGAALVVWVLWRADPERPQDTAVCLFGGALLIGTPGYPWYSLPLVVLAVMAGRVEWLAVAVAMYATYSLYRVPYLPGSAFALAGLVVLVGSRARATRAAAVSATPRVEPLSL
jgi:Glycosyltransferase family 87